MNAVPFQVKEKPPYFSCPIKRHQYQFRRTVKTENLIINRQLTVMCLNESFAYNSWCHSGIVQLCPVQAIVNLQPAIQFCRSSLLIECVFIMANHIKTTSARYFKDKFLRQSTPVNI